MSEIGEAFANSMLKSMEEVVQELKALGVDILPLTSTDADAVEWPRWIPVTERLPEPYTWVLVSAEKHKVAFDAFYDGSQWKDAVLNGLIVTYWMPLPQLPKEVPDD